MNEETSNSLLQIGICFCSVRQAGTPTLGYDSENFPIS